MLARGAIAFGVLAAALAVGWACTVTTDLSGLASGSSDASSLTGPSCGIDLVCVPAPPPGWKFVALTRSQSAVVADAARPEMPGCPDGYFQPEDLDEDLAGGAATCPCSCSADGGVARCDLVEGGTVTLGTGGCNGSPIAIASPPNYRTNLVGGGTSCATLPGTTSADAVRVSAATTQQGKCPPITASILPPWSATALRLCAVQVDPGPNACPAGRVCARDVSDPYGVCVASTNEEDGGGGEPCPPAYPTRHVLALRVADTRRCAGACECRTDGICKSLALRLYAGACGAGQTDVLADGVCHQETTQSYYSYGWLEDVTYNGPCIVVSSPAPAGEVGIAASRTVCCG
jgi:hypothetical protein